MSEPNTCDAFISYASADLAFAAEVQRRLAVAGFRVWFEKARLNSGCDWHKEIEAGCQASRVLLPILTPRWKNSEWTKSETYWGRSGAEPVIPLTRLSPQPQELCAYFLCAGRRVFGEQMGKVRQSICVVRHPA